MAAAKRYTNDIKIGIFLYISPKRRPKAAYFDCILIYTQSIYISIFIDVQVLVKLETIVEMCIGVNDMIETYSKIQNNQARGEPSRKNHLMSKVVLLIGNDAELLQPLAVKLAANGGDIALASSLLSAEAAEIIGERVQAFGGRFLLIDISNTRKSEAIINTTKRELGRMDIIVDMSAHKNKELEDTTSGDSPQTQWWLSKAVLEEISK